MVPISSFFTEIKLKAMQCNHANKLPQQSNLHFSLQTDLIGTNNFVNSLVFFTFIDQYDYVKNDVTEL